MKHILVVLTNAVDGQDDEYNEWYDNQHLKDVLALDGYVAAQRFGLAEPGPSTELSHRYLALYEIETDDLAKVHEGLGAAANTPAMPISPALKSGSVIGYFTPLGERRIAE